MASIQKTAAGCWRAQVRKLGIRDSGTFDSKREAQEWAAKRETEIVSSGGKKNLHKQTLIPDLFDRYAQTVSIHKGGRNTEGKRLQYFAYNHPSIADLVAQGVNVSGVRKEDIASWRDERLKVVKPSTVLREKNLLCNVFSKAVEWGIVEESPFKGLSWPKEPERRERAISVDEIDSMVFCLGDWDRKSKPSCNDHKIAAMFLLAIETAMRQSEIKYLNHSEVCISERVIRLSAIRTKERRKKVIGLSSEAVRLLEVCKTDGADWLGASSIDVSSRFQIARKNAGIYDLVFHDTRHEGITRLAELLNPFELARQVGHKDLGELNTYYEKQADQFAHKLG
ncbi:tyrosine-type recombinase/integrase [Zhongshania borealis]|uniref:Site-specific integrase n=1 Tax=Zhongshania borealis TaxID=889488 RepID=A0ABP7WAC9_9GAMM